MAVTASNQRFENKIVWLKIYHEQDTNFCFSSVCLERNFRDKGVTTACLDERLG